MRLEKSARGNDKEESTGGTMMTGVRVVEGSKKINKAPAISPRRPRKRHQHIQIQKSDLARNPNLRTRGEPAICIAAEGKIKPKEGTRYKPKNTIFITYKLF